MLLKPQQITFGFLLLISLGFSGWVYIHHEKTTKVLSPTTSNQVDLFAKDIFIQRFDATGKLISLLQTKHLVHLANRDTNHFTQPKILLFQAKQTPWYIEAKRGETNQHNQQITFFQQVNLRQSPSGQTPATHIMTDKLHYQPDKHSLYTNRLITMEQDNLTLQSNGMQAYLNEGRIELLSHPKGNYFADHQKN